MPKPTGRQLVGNQEARLIAVVGSAAPEGQAR